MSKAAQLKKLQQRVATIESEASDLKLRRDALLKESATLKKKMRNLTSTAPTVSEHALLRWLERVDGVDLSATKVRILGNGVLEKIRAVGSGTIPHPANVSLKVKNGVITTILKK